MALTLPSDRPTRVTTLVGVAIGLVGAVSMAAAQGSTDCNHNGIPDDLEWGPNYAYWDGDGADNNGGSMTDWALWCPQFVPFGPEDVLVFGQNPAASVDVCTFAFWPGARSIRFAPGTFEIVGTAGQEISLAPDAQGAQPEFRVNGDIRLDCRVALKRGSPKTRIGTANAAGVPLTGKLTVLGQTFETIGGIEVGIDGIGTLTVDGGSVTCASMQVGAPESSAQSRGVLVLGGAGTVAAASVTITDIARIDGTLIGTVTGAHDGLSDLPAIAGSGKIFGDVEASRLAIAPTMGVDGDGVADAELVVAGHVDLAGNDSGLGGVLRYGVVVDQASGEAVVPSVTANSVNLGGLLRLSFGSKAGDLVPTHSRILTSTQPITGAFDAVQVEGLPNNRFLRVTSNATDGVATALDITVIATAPLPTITSAAPTSLLRVAIDACFGDFDGDGDMDAAAALAADASGTSVIRYFEIEGSTLHAKVDVAVAGDVLGIAAHRANGQIVVAAAMGTADRVTMLKRTGAWTFAPINISLQQDDTPTSIVSGSFLAETGDPANAELAVGCTGNARLYILRAGASGASGAYEVARVVEGVKGHLIRKGNFDGVGGQDVAMTDRDDLRLQVVTKLDAVQGATVYEANLGVVPTGLAVATFGAPNSLQRAVVTLERSTPASEDPRENIAIFPVTLTGIAPPARLTAGNDALGVFAADLDADGDADLGVIASFQGTDQLRMLFNRAEVAGVGSLVFQDGGAMVGPVRPRIVVAQDIDGNARPEVLTVNAGNPGGTLGPEFDMGMGSNGGGGSGNQGDVNGDGVVDGNDLTAIFSAWGQSSGPDPNGDGTVDALDLAYVLGGWTP